MEESKSNEGLETVESLIATIPDFPKPGIVFKDIFPIFQQPSAVRLLIDSLLQSIQSLDTPVDAIIGKL